MISLDPKDHAWMRDEKLRALMTALGQGGDAARYVGGAVRNALLGAPVTEVDIATPLNPDEVLARLKSAGIKAVPTGIDHGTITAVVSGKPFEVTTLRRDVSTDGRRAVVAFTRDWKEDAERRDFTMNALYADADGVIYDSVGGLEDLKAGRLRFVGDAAKRIAEDYLRILRLFRFHAWYGKGDIDADALSAASSGKEGLRQLSAERVQKELLRLLESDDPAPALHAMEKAGILALILPAPSHIDVMTRLGQAGALLRLAALLPENSSSADVARVLRLSNADKERLVAARQAFAMPADERAARKMLYGRGAPAFLDAMRLDAARKGQAASHKAFLVLAENWQRPAFPVNGEDAKNAGLMPGPDMGKALGALERDWVESGFALSRETLLAKLKP